VSFSRSGPNRVLHVLAVYPPRGQPMRHAMVLGAAGLVLSTAGAIATIPMDLGSA
jgi:hypothetical protein